MKHKSLIVLFILLFLPHFSTAASVRPVFILGLGGGYSMIADGAVRSNEYSFDNLIDFKEKLRLKNLWRFNLQAYFLQDFGIQVEYTHQKADYFSDLKWYGWWDTTGTQPIYIPINYFEEPYRTPWSLKSTSIGLVIGGNRALFGELFPYATAGIGYYKIKGNPDLFLNRTRLGSLTQGMTVKISGGVRHRIFPFLGINLRISGETLYRSHGRIGMETIDPGPDQLDIELYYRTGHIFRTAYMLAKAITYISVEINLEFIFKIPHRMDK
jgi:hypothetical protein